MSVKIVRAPKRRYVINPETGFMDDKWVEYIEKVQENVESLDGTQLTAVTGATAGNIASLTAAGAIQDSGKSASAPALNWTQAEFVADVAAVTEFNIPAGSDSIDRAALDALLSTMFTEINAIRTAVNDIKTALVEASETAGQGIMANE